MLEGARICYPIIYATLLTVCESRFFFRAYGAERLSASHAAVSRARLAESSRPDSAS